MKLEEMTKDERSLILFLETQAVDHGGIVDVAHMNGDDFEIAERWTGTGFAKVGRIAFEFIPKHPSMGRRAPTHWVHLSDEAFAMAHEERKARAGRVWGKRLWKKAEEM